MACPITYGGLKKMAHVWRDVKRRRSLQRLCMTETVIIFPVVRQTVIIAQMTSTGREAMKQ